jgi:alanine racemase
MASIRSPKPRAQAARPGGPAAAAAARARRRTWAEIDLDALQHNVKALCAAARPARLAAVVKADAYGHGAVEVARSALEAGAAFLGVATLDEAVELRRAGIAAPILLLGYTAVEDAEPAVAHDLAVTVFDLDLVRALGAAARRTGRRARIHLKVDTGMGRIGVPPDAAGAFARAAAALPGIALEGCFTHFATADEPDTAAARAQLEAFHAALRGLDAASVAPGLRHAANSAALLALPDARLDLVRPGIALYGIPPAPHLAGAAALRRVMRLRSRVAQVKRVPAGTPVGYGHTYRAPRETTIATVPAGYADGYARLLSGRGEVAVAGRLCPLAGRISMDQCTVDAGDAPVRVGDLVELWGDAIPVEEVAARAETIAYEMLAGVCRRVPRVFQRGGRVAGVRTLLGDG